MFGAHMPEMLIILVLALIVFGPKRLPEMGSSLGRGIRNFKHGLSHLDLPEGQLEPESAHALHPLPVESAETLPVTSAHRLDSA